MLKLVIISIVLGSLVALAALICGTILVIIKIRSSNSTRGSDREEAKIIQEIYQGLDQMEERIEALEVILSENKQFHNKARENNNREKRDE